MAIKYVSFVLIHKEMSLPLHWLTSSWRRASPSQILKKHVWFKSFQNLSTTSTRLGSTEQHSTTLSKIHTISFVEDVLGRLAQVSIAGRHSHRFCKTKTQHNDQIILLTLKIFLPTCVKLERNPNYNYAYKNYFLTFINLTPLCNKECDIGITNWTAENTWSVSKT